MVYLVDKREYTGLTSRWSILGHTALCKQKMTQNCSNNALSPQKLSDEFIKKIHRIGTRSEHQDSNRCKIHLLIQYLLKKVINKYYIHITLTFIERKSSGSDFLVGYGSGRSDLATGHRYTRTRSIT